MSPQTPTPSESVQKSDKGGPLLWDFRTLLISDPQSSGLSSLKGSAKPGGVRLTPDGFAVVPLQLATENSYCKPEG